MKTNVPAFLTWGYAAENSRQNLCTYSLRTARANNCKY